MDKLLKNTLAFTGIALLTMSAMPVDAQCIGPKTIDGKWSASDGGTYFVRVLGNSVWWVGMSGDNGMTWTNVFKGTRTGDVIQGDWADVRTRKGGGSGVLKLRVTGTSLMDKIGETGAPYTGRRWSRGECNDTQ